MFKGGETLPNPKLPTTNGREEVPAFVALAHELAHAWGAAKGNKNEEPWFKHGDQIVTKDEFFASVIENYVRADHNLSIRTHYAEIVVNGEIVPYSPSALFESISYLPSPSGNPADAIISFQYIDIRKLKMK